MPRRLLLLSSSGWCAVLAATAGRGPWLWVIEGGSGESYARVQIDDGGARGIAYLLEGVIRSPFFLLSGELFR